MTKLKIYDHSVLKTKHKVNDDSFKKFCDECDESKIDHVDLKRNPKGELILWEIYYNKN